MKSNAIQSILIHRFYILNFDHDLTKAAMVFEFTISIAILISVGVLFCWHIYLCLTNQVTSNNTGFS